MSQTAPRPGQATFAGWLIIASSMILVVTAWQRISTLHTLEVQEELQRLLSEPPVSGTGLSLETLETTIRILCMVAAGAATASAILGFQALQRSTSARLVLTLLAPLVLVGGFATAGFFAPMVVAGVVMLWLRPTRDWFAGRPWAAAGPRPGPDPFARPAPGGTEEKTPEPGRPEVEREPRTHEQAADEPPHEPGPHSTPYASPLSSEAAPAAASPYAPAARRPGALVAACVITWVSSAIVAGMMLLFSLIMAVAQDEFFEELERQQPDLDLRGMSHAELATGTYVLTGIVVLWCFAATVLAVLAFRRVTWARIALAICTGAAGLLCLAGALLSPGLVVLLAATSVTLWLLLRADVGAWFRR